MNFRHPAIALVLTCCAAALARADASAAARPHVVLSVGAEEGQKELQVTVTQNDKPLPNVTVQFLVKRTFGGLIVGEDQTLDDGTAAVKFPQDLPGGESGQLHIYAKIKAPPQYAGVQSDELVTDGGVKVLADPDPFPRAFWSPHAPIWLIVTIFGLIGGVWVTYVFVVSQIVAIKKDKPL